MFKNKTLIMAMVSLLILPLLFLASCSDDEDDTTDNCTADFVSQTATGLFMGNTFTMVEGTAGENFADSTEFWITLYGEAVTGDACDNFNFDKPDLSIIFTVPMTVGTYELSFGAYSVTFNDASVPNTTNADVAVCGAVEITSITATTVSGKIDADADANSYLNGNFTVERCL